MDFHLILSDCALENKKQNIGLVIYIFELECKRKEGYFIFPEANC